MISFSTSLVYAQSLNDVFSSDLTAWIKIIEPVKEQVIELGQDIGIRGEATAGLSQDCRVLIIINNVKSSKKEIPVDLKGNHLVSHWKFVLHGNYELFNEGQNTITAELHCSNSETINSYTVLVTGVRPASTDSVEPLNTVTNLDQGHEHKIDSQINGFDIVAAGDYGCNPITEDVVNKMKEKNPDLVLAIGDLSEVKDPACFFDLFSDYKDNVKVAFGEHDTDSNDKNDSSSRFSQYENHFDLDQPFYSFDHQNVHFLAMSTGKDEIVPFGIGSPQYNFVVNDLARASMNQDIDWIIVYGYRPFYSSPTVHPGPKLTRDIYHPIFEKYGVDLVINGHNHNYQRTYPLKLNALSQSNPIVTDENKSNYVNPRGPIFVTVGTAGNELYDLLDQYPFVATQFKRNGFLDIHVSNNGTRLIGSFYDNINGTDEDSFTINKL